MSLYGGIKFSAAELEVQRAESVRKEEEAKKNAPKGKPSSPVITSSQVLTKPSASTSKLPSLGSTSKAPIKLPPGQSAALNFAPRIRQTKPPAPPRPIGNYTAAPVIEKQPDLVRPSSAAQPSKWGEDEDVLGQDGKVLARAPAMTLGPGAGEKGKGMKRDREEEKKRKKKNKVRAHPTRLISTR